METVSKSAKNVIDVLSFFQVELGSVQDTTLV